MSDKTIATAYVQVLPSAEGMSQNLASELSGATQGANNTNSAFKNLASQGIQMATTAAINFAKESITVGMNFEAAMDKVAAISGASAADMELLEAKASEMGANTSFSATEAADALGYMAMAGWKTKDMVEGLDGIMYLAGASGEDLATTSDIVTDALTAFGYEAKDSSHFADVLAVASSNANTNVSMMGGTFKYVAPIAGALGYNVEDTAAAIGLMANAGIKADQAGTSLRAMLIRLSKGEGAAGKAMEELGVSMTDSEGNMRSLDDVIGQLRTGFSGLTEEEKAKYASDIAGQEAMSGLLAIVNASEADYNKLTTAISNSDGAAKDMYTTMKDNLQGGMESLQSKIEALQKKLFEKLEPVLRKVVDALSGFLDFIINIDENHHGLVVAIEAAAAAFVTLKTAMAIDNLLTSIPTLLLKAQTAFATFSTFIMGAGGPIVALAALAATLTLVIDKYNQLKDTIAEMDEVGGRESDSLQTSISENRKFEERVKKGEAEDWEYRAGKGIFNKKTGKQWIPYYASGGIVKSPTLAMIGEAGPEAVVPLGRSVGSMDTILNSVFGSLMSSVPASASTTAQTRAYGNDKPLQIELILGRESLGRIAVDSINELQRKSGKVLLEV